MEFWLGVFFSRYWKELKCLISCIPLQWLTLYRTSVICSAFIAVHIEGNDELLFQCLHQIVQIFPLSSYPFILKGLSGWFN